MAPVDLLAAAAPRLCPDCVEARDDDGIFSVSTYQLDKETGEKRGQLSLYQLVTSEHDSIAWSELCSVDSDAVFDAKW